MVKTNYCWKANQQRAHFIFAAETSWFSLSPNRRDAKEKTQKLALKE
jgi:hypothetical protein